LKRVALLRPSRIRYLIRAFRVIMVIRERESTAEQVKRENKKERENRKKKDKEKAKE